MLAYMLAPTCMYALGVAANKDSLLNILFRILADALTQALGSDPAVTITAGLMIFSILATGLILVLATLVIWTYCCLFKGELGSGSTHALAVKITGALGMYQLKNSYGYSICTPAL